MKPTSSQESPDKVDEQFFEIWAKELEMEAKREVWQYHVQPASGAGHGEEHRHGAAQTWWDDAVLAGMGLVQAA